MGCSMPRTSALACPVQTTRLTIAAGCFLRLRLLAHLVPIGQSQSQLRQDFLMWDRLVVLEPFIGLGDGLAFGIAEGIAILVWRNHRSEERRVGKECRSRWSP